MKREEIRNVRNTRIGLENKIKQEGQREVSNWKLGNCMSIKEIGIESLKIESLLSKC